MREAPLLKEAREITIPEVEIAQGWLVSSLEAVDDCDDALTYLTEAIASITAQLALHATGTIERDPHWRAKSQTALMWKRHAREAVFRRRAMLRRAELKAIEWVKTHDPELWEEALRRAA